MKKIDSKTICIAIFMLFFAFLIAQYSRIFLYSDDYGYGSLSYAVSTDKQGMAGFFDYLFQHYIHWGGRVLYYSLLILAVKAGLNVIRFTECLIIFVSFYFIFKCTLDRYDGEMNIKKALLTCFFYGSISSVMATQSLYWYSAAITYTLPFLTTIVFFYYTYNILISGKGIGVYSVIMLSILAFVTGFSQEQYAMADCLAYLILGFYLYRRKKLTRIFWIIGIALLIGSCCLIFAPGNFARAGGFSDSLIIVLKNRLFSIVEMLFGQFTKAYMLIMVASFIVYSLFCRSYGLFMIFEIILAAVYYRLGSPMDLFAEEDWWRVVISCMAILVLVVHAYFISVNNDRFLLFILYFIGVMTAFAMIISDQFQPRTFLPFQLLTMPLVIWLISDVRIKYKIEWLMIISCCLIFAKNMFYIFDGYQKNYEVNKINYERLVMEADKNDPILYLYKNVDDSFSYVTPYMYDFMFQYQEENMKLYFGINPEVKFEWVEYTQG